MSIDTRAFQTLTVTGTTVVAATNTRGLAAQNYALGLAQELTGWAKLQHGLGDIYAEWRLAEIEAMGAGGGVGLNASQFASSNSVARIAEGYVGIDAFALDGNGAALLASLRVLGLIQGASFGAAAGGLIPIAALDELAAIGNLAFAQPVYAMTNVGTVTTQDDTALRTDDLRALLGVNGSGVTVGILSDSFNTRVGPITNYAQDVTSGDLPAGVNVLVEGPANSSDEGRAMAQLVYDLAPGVNLAFHSAFISQASFAAGIVALAGVARVVVDDVFYFAEPAFQDGPIAQAVDQAVDLGAIYFSSAGNSAARAYESAFRGSGQLVNITGGVAAGTYQYHDFDPGAGVATTQQITLGAGSNIVLQWDQAYRSAGGASAGSTTDMAIVVFNSGGAPIAVVNSLNVGADPVEIVGTFSEGTYFIGILLRDGHSAPGTIHYRVVGGSYTANTFATPSATSYGHSNAAGAIGVAAVPWFNTPEFGVPSPIPEPFTSRGGLPILFNGDGQRLGSPELRNTVEFAATDGGNTTFFSADSAADADSFPNFFGTSAAAPNAAAVAALLISKFPTATNAQIAEALRLSAIDITTGYAGSAIGVGADITTGAGLIQAPAAAAALQAMLSAQAAAAGTANQIAFIGFNTGQSDSSGNPPTTDSLSFVALNALTAGTVIYITDRAWTGTAFTTAAGDGTYAYTVPAGGIAAGTVITLPQATLIAAGVDLSEAGDALYAYIGSTADAPLRFLHAIEIGDGNRTFEGSLAGTGLIVGTSAVAVGTDSGAYVGPTTEPGALLASGGATGLIGSVSTVGLWTGDDRDTVNAIQQPVQSGPWLVAADVDLVGVGAGGGAGLAKVSGDATAGALGFNPATFFNGATVGGNPITFGARDIVFDAADGKFFIADAVSGNNRILQGNIADLRNLSSPPTLTVLYSDIGTGEVSQITGLEIDQSNNIVYFLRGSQLIKLNYDTAGQVGIVLFESNVSSNPVLGGFANANAYSLNDVAINFTTGEVFISASKPSYAETGDGTGINSIYRLVGLTPQSGSGSFTFDGSNSGSARLLVFSPSEVGYNPFAGTTIYSGPLSAAQYIFPTEYGALTGVSVNPATNTLYFSTRELRFDNDANPNTPTNYSGGVIGSYVVDGGNTYTILYQQTALEGGIVPGRFGDIEIDPVSGRYYVLDTVGTAANPFDQSIYTGSLTTPGAPTVFATPGNVQGLTTNGFALNHAPTLAVTGNPVSIEENPGAGSGETIAVSAFSGVSIADIDTIDGSSEIAGAVVRIATGFQGGANQDYLRVAGALSGTVSGTAISFAYNAATGVLVFSGAGTTAQYQAAIGSITLSISGDNPTAFGTATSRVLGIAVTDGLSVSDERTTTIAINAVNDAPVNVVPVGPLTAAEDVPLAITGLSVSDPDANPATQKLSVTLAASVGTITVSFTVPGGLTPADITGNGTGSVTLSGTQNELNTLFASPIGVRYVKADNGTAAATITMTTSDQGASGGAAQTDVDSFTINVADTNEAPIIAGFSATASVLENQLTLLMGGSSLADSDSANFDGGSLTIAISFNAQAAQDQLRLATSGSLTVTGNVLSVSGVDVGTFTGGGVGGGSIVVSFNANATPTAALAVLRGVAYLNTSDTPVTTSRSISYTLVDGDGTAGGGTDRTTVIQSIGVIAVNDAPSGVDATRVATEDQVRTLAASDFPFTDVELNTLAGVRITTLPTAGMLMFDADGAGGNPAVAVTTGQLITAAELAAGALSFVPAANANGTAYASLTFQVQDNGGVTNGGVNLDPTANTLTFDVTAVDDLPVAVADAATTAENATIVALAVVANDTDVDGGPKAVATIAGQAVAPGGSVTLPSGAIVTLNPDGTLSYNPNGAFNALISAAKAAATGATANTQATDVFAYVLNGGSSANVTVTVTGVDGPGDRLNGTGGDNAITGTGADDYLDLSQGGTDAATGGEGNDSLFFGANFGAGDSVNGGAGTNDQLGLQGNYPALTLTGAQISGVEAIAVLPGFSYGLATADDLVGPGGQMVIYAGGLGAGDAFTFNGAAETNGSFTVYGGLGTDTITTGAGNDGIYFGPGAFNPATDTVNGGVGTNDQVALDGDYTLTLTGAMFQNVEVIALLAGTPGNLADYTLTLADSLAANGTTLTVYGAGVVAPMTIDASQEATAAIRIFGGVGGDTLTGGGGADWLWGNFGDDALRGNGGADRFHFSGPATGIDTIADFTLSQGDMIEMDDAGFTALTPGALSAAAFTTGTVATTAAHRIVYNNTTGELFYDADGSGAGAAVLFARLTGAPVLAASDFVIV